MDEIQLFWGCFIPNKFPWIEKSIRAVFKKLEYPFAENNRFTCCPEPQLKNLDEENWYVTAGRNLAVAEELGMDILTPCNGCFETLKSVKILMRERDDINKKVNDELATMTPPLHFGGSIDVFHAAEFFWRIKERIKDKIVKPLEGLKVSVHYGCHLVRPSREIQIDNPFEPRILDELVKILGAESVTYPDKLLCCGGSYERAGNKDASLSTVHRKLKHMREAGAEVIVVSCPNCYSQFEYEQLSLAKQDVKFDLPVFFITDLIGLAIGLKPEELGLGFHIIDVNPALKAMNEIMVTRESISEDFDIDEIENCIACSACVDDCPPTKLGLLDPPAILRKVISGKLDEVIKDQTIWSCLDCYTCLELCPNGVGYVTYFKKLRNMASRAGYAPKGFSKQEETFKKLLKVIPYSKSKRKRLGLPEMERARADDLKKKINDQDH
ncbi:MAG: heterodisulfide reductase-related iron-sulfur binding cluster [Promethearchaeota archaeon]